MKKIDNIEEQKKRIGRPKGTKGGGPKGFTAIPGCEEIAVVVKLPVELKEVISAKSAEEKKTFKELVVTTLMEKYMPDGSTSCENDVAHDMAEALAVVVADPNKFHDLPEEFQTPLTLQAALTAASKYSKTYILLYCPEHLAESVDISQWMEALEVDYNIFKKIPKKHQTAAMKLIREKNKE